MPFDNFKHAIDGGRHPAWDGSGVSTASYPFVLHENAENAVAVVSTMLPYGILDATATNHAEVRPVHVPQAFEYLDVFAMRDDDGTVTTPPSVTAWGQLPHRASNVGQVRAWPQDITSVVNTFDDRSGTDEGFWIQLPHVAPTGAVQDVHSYTLVPGAIALDAGSDNRGPAATATADSWGQPTTYHLRGVIRVIVAVTSAASSDPEITILGHFWG